MSKSPAYLWYPRDIFDSARVEELSPAEECWYRRALDRCWGDEGISSDPVKAAKRIGKKCTVKAAEMILKTFFIPKPKDATKMINERQESERKKLSDKLKQRSAAGKKGMATRWKQKSKSDNTVITPLQSRNNISIPISISNQVKNESDDAALPKAVFVGTVLSGIKKELDVIKLPNTTEREWQQHAEMAFDNGFTAEQFLECYSDMRAKKTYKILPAYVTDQLPDFTKGRVKKIEKLPSVAELVAKSQEHGVLRAAPKADTETIH